MSERVITLGSFVAGGLVEGVLIAPFQWRVLHRLLPRLPFASWVGATVAVAATGWLLGGLSSALGVSGGTEADAAGPPLAVTLAGALVMGLVFGALFGAAQRAVLRHHASGTAAWVTANTAGWAIGLIAIMAAATAPDGSTPLWVVLSGAASSGAFAGLFVGLTTGTALARLEPNLAPV